MAQNSAALAVVEEVAESVYSLQVVCSEGSTEVRVFYIAGMPLEEGELAARIILAATKMGGRRSTA